MQTSEAGAHRVWDGTITTALVANESIVANTGGQAGRSNFFKLSLQLGDQVVVLSFADWWTHYPPPNCGLERNSRLRRWHRPSKDLFRGVISGVWRFFFFFVGTAIVASLNGQQDVQCSNCTVCLKRGAEPTCPERLLRTSAVSDLDVPTTYHKCVS